MGGLVGDIKKRIMGNDFFEYVPYIYIIEEGGRATWKINLVRGWRKNLQKGDAKTGNTAKEGLKKLEINANKKQELIESYLYY